jgi:hypothetical protein
LEAKKTGVVAFAFGFPNTTFANRRIMEQALFYTYEQGQDVYESGSAPVYLQRDVAPLPEHLGIDCTVHPQSSAEPPSTLGVARGAILWAKERHIEILKVAAAPMHVHRAERDLYAAAREACMRVHIAKRGLVFTSEKEWFIGSAQRHTSSPWVWYPREYTLKLMPFWLYKYITA